jgi:hypothetical protein
VTIAKVDRGRQEMPQITVSDESKKMVETFAKQMDCSAPEAADRLFATARSRINALRKYAKRVTEGEVGKKAKKVAKKPAAKKVAKKAAPAAKAA